MKTITAEILPPPPGSKLQYRVVPFKLPDTQAQMYSLVEEWFYEGKLWCDKRRALDADSFATLVRSVHDAVKETM